VETILSYDRISRDLPSKVRHSGLENGVFVLQLVDECHWSARLAVIANNTGGAQQTFQSSHTRLDGGVPCNCGEVRGWRFNNPFSARAGDGDDVVGRCVNDLCRRRTAEESRWLSTRAAGRILFRLTCLIERFVAFVGIDLGVGLLLTAAVDVDGIGELLLVVRFG